ncbi:hypothetical protein JZX86_27735 [Agrobacterium rosae]|uniref:phage tail tip lysozyme n=1 Tax=Agrobacterium rosae TaxID=1972867 RepID=UPI0019D3338A|nr:phage tail tip lysozyme [Agrobacterium rosae]MBN7809115.1 hypothetical protein [Agrobacterium rosae]
MAKPALNDNARYAYKYYQDKYKLAPHQAAGIVGNLMQESTFNTGARNAGDGRDGSDSIGIGQWNQDRARNLRAFGGDKAGDLDTQLDFVMHELQGSGGNGGGSEATAWRNLQNAKDVHGATAAMIGYERPSGYSVKNPTAGHGFDNRFAWAGEVAGLSPEDIASAKPTSANIVMASNAAQQAAPANPDASTAPETASSDKPLFTLPKLLPDKILGVETKKGMMAMSGITDAIAKNDAQMNQQIQQTAQSAQSRRGSSQPIEVAQVQAPTFSNRSAQPSPAEIEEIKKKMAMARMGGLGGLGGFGRG